MASAARHELLELLVQLSSPDQAEQEAIFGRLYNASFSALEECLLQVTHVCITHGQPEVQMLLQNFLRYLAGRSLQLALRLSWTLDAVSNFFQDIGLGERLRQLKDSVESCAINQMQNGNDVRDSTQRSSSSARTSPASTSNADVPEAAPHSPAIDTLQAWRKEARLKMFNDQRRFVTTLTDLGNYLRLFSDRAGRKSELRRRLHEVNAALRDLWLMHPLGLSSDPVRWIVRIAVEECHVFSSRERAPYLIRYEVIVDESATMADPTRSTIRQPDGSFSVMAGQPERYEPHVVPPAEAVATPEPATAEKRASTKATGASPGPSAAPAASDASTKAFGESSSERASRVRARSPWGSHPNWGMACMIVKAGDDLRQEELALQLIRVFNSIWTEAGVTCCARPYMALPTCPDCGLIEVVEDSNSVDGIKKSCGVTSLAQFFSSAFGGERSYRYHCAQRRFVEAMAGYSIIAYILQIKDRHNGNLMISREGELVHIDFGFLFATSPGGLNFESAPFKLSQELIDVMGGVTSDAFNYFKVLIFLGMECARERAEDLLALVSLMIPYNTLPCLGVDPQAVIGQMRSKFRYELTSEPAFALYCKDLVANSADNWRTRRYDQFQTLQNGHAVICFGHPLLDIMATVDADFLSEYGITPGDIKLAAPHQLSLFTRLMHKYPQIEYVPGGAAMNTARTLEWVCPSLKVSYVGALGDDAFAVILREALEKAGVHSLFEEHTAQATGTCAALVHENDRSLLAHLGAAVELTLDHLFSDPVQRSIAEADLFYAEGFFLNTVSSPDNLLSVAIDCHRFDKLFTFNLNAPYISERFASRITALMPHIDVLFGSEEDILAYAAALWRPAFTPPAATASGVVRWREEHVAVAAHRISELPTVCPARPRLVVVTCGARDTIVAIAHTEEVRRFPVEVVPAEAIVDLNGAGDAFVGGFLAQYLLFNDVAASVRAGHAAARSCITHSGATIGGDPPSLIQGQ